MGARCTQMWRTRRGAHARDHATPPRLRRASFLVAPANGTRCLYEITERAVFLNSIKENLFQVRRIFFLGENQIETQAAFTSQVAASRKQKHPQAISQATNEGMSTTTEDDGEDDGEIACTQIFPAKELAS